MIKMNLTGKTLKEEAIDLEDLQPATVDLPTQVVISVLKINQGPISNPEDFAKLLTQQGYSNECITLFKEKWAYMALAIPATGLGTWLAKMYVLSNFDMVMRVAGFSKIIGKGLAKLKPAKGLARVAGKLNRKGFWIFFLSLFATGTGGAAAVWNGAAEETKENFLNGIVDISKMIYQVPMSYLTLLWRSVRDSSPGREIGLKDNDCAPIIYSLIIAFTAVATASIIKTPRPLNKANIDKFIKGILTLASKLLRKSGQVGAKRFTELCAEHASEANHPKLREFIKKLENNIKKDIQWSNSGFVKERLKELGLDPNVLKEGENYIDLIWNGTLYVSKEEADRLAKMAAAQAKKGDDIIEEASKQVKEAGKQLKLFADEAAEGAKTQKTLALSGPDNTQALDNLADEAFNAGNLKDAVRYQQKLFDFYKESGLLQGLGELEKVDDTIKAIRAEFPDATDFDVMKELLNKSEDIFGGLRVDESAAVVAQLGQKAGLEITDDAAKDLVVNHVEDIIRYYTSNLPPSTLTQEGVDEVTDKAMEAALKLFNDTKASSKISPKAAAVIALASISALFAGGAVYSSNKFKPTGSPYYFEDDSIYSFLNSVTGANEFKKFRNNILSDRDKVIKMLKEIFSSQNPVTEKFINELSEIKEIDLDPKSKAERVLKDFAGEQKSLILNKIDELYAFDNTDIYPDQTTTGINWRRNVLFLMIVEILIYNTWFADRLEDYFENQLGATEDQKKEYLKNKVFKASELSLKQTYRKINNLERYYANDYRSSRSEKINENNNRKLKTMSKKDISQLVAEVLNENYSKYPYNANEPSEGEPDEDYMVEWSALVDEVCGSKVKNVDGDPKTIEDAAVEVAKLFVKDQDLFRDVLEMAGSNKSIGVEILQQLKAAREKNV